MKRFIYILIMIMISLPVSSSANEQSMIKKGNQAYANGKYETAAAYYDSVLARGKESAKLYYNLGNAHFKQDNLAQAILNYERAKKLAPFNDQINHNLKFARQRQKDDIEQLPVMFYVRWWNTLTNLFPLHSWAVLSVVFSFLTAGVWILFIIARQASLKRHLFRTGIIISLLFLFILFITIRNHEHQDKKAIVFASVITGKSSPDPASKELFVIHKGMKVHVLNKIGDWYEVRLPDGTVGWLPADSLEVI